MAHRYSAFAFVHYAAILLLLVLPDGSAALSFEDKLEQMEKRLESKVAQVVAVNVDLKEKVTQLEAQLQQQVITNKPLLNI